MALIRLIVDFFNKIHDCIEDLLGIEPEYVDSDLENGYLDKSYVKPGNEDFEIVQLDESCKKA